jgi:hypothetical protein
VITTLPLRFSTPQTSSSSSQHRTITRLEECLDIGEGPSPKDWCPSYHTCHACAAIPGCTWDIDKNSRCKETSRRKSGGLASPAPTENSKTSGGGGNVTTASRSDDDDEDQVTILRQLYYYNSGVVVGYSVFHFRRKYFCLQNALGSRWQSYNSFIYNYNYGVAG